MKGKGLWKRVFSMVMALVLVVGLISVSEPKKAEAASDEWVLTPSDHTPASGVELPTNVTAIKTAVYNDSSEQQTASTATIQDGMALVGQDSVTRLYMSVSAGTTYVTSFYVWTMGEETVFDMHFDAAGSPAQTAATSTYVSNVLANWKSTYTDHIQSCMVDGVEATSNITGETGGWKKVEVEWTPKASGDVVVALGDYGGSSNVVGTIYIDDFVTYVKPTEYPVTLTRFWGTSSGTGSLVTTFTYDDSTQTIPSGSVFEGTIMYNGSELNARFAVSGGAFFIKDSTGDITYQSSTSIEIPAGTKLYTASGDYITISNACSYAKEENATTDMVKNATTAVSTDIALYKITDSMTAYTYTADLPTCLIQNTT